MLTYISCPIVSFFWVAGIAKIDSFSMNPNYSTLLLSAGLVLHISSFPASSDTFPPVCSHLSSWRALTLEPPSDPRHLYHDVEVPQGPALHSSVVPTSFLIVRLPHHPRSLCWFLLSSLKCARHPHCGALPWLLPVPAAQLSCVFPALPPRLPPSLGPLFHTAVIS